MKINAWAILIYVLAPICEDKCLGYINLRLGTDTDKALVKSAIGVALPEINHIITDNGISVMGFSPTEWIIITPTGMEDEVIGKLNKTLDGTHHLVADITGGMTNLNVTGKHAKDMLEKGTYVDLHDSVFKKGQLYATQIAHAPAVIVKNGHNEFSLIVRRSFSHHSHHIANWAVDAAAEYGFSFN